MAIRGLEPAIFKVPSDPSRSTNPVIGSELFGWSLSHVQILSSGGNHCRKLQSALLRAVLQEFLTGQTEKREHYALEHDRKLIEQLIFVGFTFSGPQKKERKKIRIVQKIFHTKQKKNEKKIY